MDIISGLACISELRPANPVILIDYSAIKYQPVVEQIITAAAGRCPEVSFRTFGVDSDKESIDFSGKGRFVHRYDWIKKLKSKADASVQAAFGTPLAKLHENVECIYFTVPTALNRVLLEACRKCPRVLYPHGFDCPRTQEIQDEPCYFQPRGWLTALRSLRCMHNYVGKGEILISAVVRICGGHVTCAPYEGSDSVYTFRQSPLEIATPLVRLTKLKETFQWLVSVSPWVEELDKARQDIRPRSVILLLSEYDRPAIWNANRHWTDVHHSIAKATLLKTGADSLVIKAHPRSDGSAAAYLFDFFVRTMPEVTIHMLPETLSVLPIEALALGLRFSAACSIGSCSLPGDIGIDVPHYISPRISEFFDKGWNGVPFWAKYGEGSRMLIAAGICRDVDSPDPA